MYILLVDDMKELAVHLQPLLNKSSKQTEVNQEVSPEVSKLNHSVKLTLHTSIFCCKTEIANKIKWSFSSGCDCSVKI